MPDFEVSRERSRVRPGRTGMAGTGLAQAIASEAESSRLRQVSGWKRNAKFAIGDVVRHRRHPFRGVVFDIDATFNHTEEWWEAIPKDVRPSKEQPYYHLLAENDDATYVAYVSEQNLLLDETGKPCRHPEIDSFFEEYEDGRYRPRPRIMN